MRRSLTVTLVVVRAGFLGFAGSGQAFARLASNQASRVGYRTPRTSPIQPSPRSAASS